MEASTRAAVSYPRRVVRTLRRWSRLPWSDRVLVLEALLGLGLMRLLLIIVPFKYLAPRLGRKLTETCPDEELSAEYQAQRIGWVVRRLAARTPWESKCLVQAMTAKHLLQRRGIASTLYLGVAWGEEERRALTAHAWLRCGSHFVTGGEGHLTNRVICTFGPRE